MSTPIDNGVPAFPSSVSNGPDGTRTSQSFGLGGMDLRDWFEGQALVGMDCASDMKNDADRARWAYMQADAVIAERKKAKA